MRRWWLVLALLLSLGVNLGLVASRVIDRLGSERRGPPPRAMTGREAPPRAFERLADRLELEGETRQRFVDLQRRLFAAVIETRRQRGELEEQLHRELTAPEPDRERLEAILDELARSHRALEGTLAETVLESRALLEPDQQRRYVDFLSRLRAHGGRGPQHPPGRRPLRRH